MAPSIYSWASSTLAAQLGTRPTSAVSIGWKMPMPPKIPVMASSPTDSKISPIRKLKSRMNTKISSVWRRAARKMLLVSSCSSWQSTSSAWPSYPPYSEWGSTLRSGKSSSTPPTMAKMILQTISKTRVVHWLGSAASSGMASSLVAINTANSVPGVMTRLA